MIFWRKCLNKCWIWLQGAITVYCMWTNDIVLGKRMLYFSCVIMNRFVFYHVLLVPVVNLHVHQSLVNERYEIIFHADIVF